MAGALGRRLEKRGEYVLGAGHPAPLLVQGGTAIPVANLARFDVIVVNGPTLLSIPV